MPSISHEVKGPMVNPTDRMAQLEARIAELEADAAVRRERQLPRPRIRLGRGARRVVVIGLVMALVVPAGVVLANHQFSDVPTGSSIHDDVEAIADAGVTTGCGDGKYCPSNPVTRGQMAQFMNRLGALDGQAPVVHADRLDGRHANELLRAAYMAEGASTPVSPTPIQFGDDLVITAPTAGHVLVNAAFTFFGTNCTTDCGAYGIVRHVEADRLSPPGIAWAGVDAHYGSASTQRLYPVEAGANTFELLMARETTDGTITAYIATVTATFIPFGPDGE